VIAIHITEHGRVWPAEEVAALGEVCSGFAPITALESALESRGYRVLMVSGIGLEYSAEVEHDVPAVTGESVTDEQVRELRRAIRLQPVQQATFIALDQRYTTERRAEARARCAAALNARRGAR
jgi:hypothetical protein